VHYYPLLNLFWSMLFFFFWLLWIFLVVRIIMDIFASDDLGGWGKAGWTLFVIVVPFIAVLIYLIVRGKDMSSREYNRALRHSRVSEAQPPGAGRSTASSADELTKLATLRDQGVLTDAEFATQKAKLLA
jgi:hypothetical protein